MNSSPPSQDSPEFCPACEREGKMRPCEPGKDECFKHRVSTIGFKFIGGGGYTREAFHERTNQEFLIENCGGTERELVKRTDREKVG